MNAYSRLIETLPYFAPDGDEIRVLSSVAERLRLGLSVYGPMHLDSDGRDMRIETTEEMIDATVYLAAKLLREGIK